MGTQRMAVLTPAWAMTLVRKIVHEYDCTVPEVKFTHKTDLEALGRYTMFGQIYVYARCINEDRYQPPYWTLRSVLVHEMAHHIAGFSTGHGPNWAMINECLQEKYGRWP